MRRGFTLIEIIISVGLVALIGTISIFSFNIIKKNNKEKTLESMSETIFNAVNVYLESNTDVKKQLYNNKNGLKIPLTTLENSGLVDFGDLSDDLDDEDFVVTMLGSTDPNDDTCAKTYTAKSWDITDNETIYICEKSNGTTNLVQVAGPADNLSKVTREDYYFIGNSKNYIQLNGEGQKYRIISVLKDDSLVLYHNESFADTFSSDKVLPITAITADDNHKLKIKNLADFGVNRGTSCGKVGERAQVSYLLASSLETLYINVEGEAEVSIDDIILTSKCVMFSTSASPLQTFAFDYGEDEYHQLHFNSWIQNSISSSGYLHFTGYKIRLNPCMKITGGTGDFSTPYILSSNCPN